MLGILHLPLRCLDERVDVATRYEQFSTARIRSGKCPRIEQSADGAGMHPEQDGRISDGQELRGRNWLHLHMLYPAERTNAHGSDSYHGAPPPVKPPAGPAQTARLARKL